MTHWVKCTDCSFVFALVLYLISTVSYLDNKTTSIFMFTNVDYTGGDTGGVSGNQIGFRYCLSLVRCGLFCMVQQIFFFFFEHVSM